MPYKNRQDLYAAQKRHRQKVHRLMLEYLENKVCIDCGESDPVVLDFDHVDPNEKFKGISRMLSGHYAWETILTEIRKCEVRCSNCHRRKTYFQLGYWGKN